ncbi:ES1 protein like protein, mitochondrial [Tupaia chinensis]|uniref:ES1 protein like protein, mitochondrial n=1 Tax=Tupaia chinensis TaxID=246437 RepID=L8Y1T4_TUPCH|nr:ES1 protein like protein, mitochondrial [Tupaia chinensis]
MGRTPARGALRKGHRESAEACFSIAARVPGLPGNMASQGGGGDTAQCFSAVQMLRMTVDSSDPCALPAPPPSDRQVLSGCGVYDGTEIHEASAILVHLSRGGAEVQIFAPDVPQMHVIDHTKGQPSEGETRNVLTESGRIARGKITSLAELRAANHDAAIFPGGFGAAKNLSTFAVDGKDCNVNKDVERVLKEFHKAGKPIGLCCIAPVLAAKVLRGVEVTVGHEQEEGGKWPYAGTAEAIKALGAKHCVKEVTISFLAAGSLCVPKIVHAHVDQKNKVVTTPAFMCETALHHIHDGIGAMVKKVLELARK